MGGSSYGRLLEPGLIGPIRTRNRIVMPAMDQNACSADGLITDEVVAHYEERAAGGVGLAILETSAVSYPSGATSRHQPSLSGDECIPGLRRLGEAVHRHGTALVVQVCHHGKVARIDTLDGRPHLVPSVPLTLPRPDLANITPEELTRIIAVSGSGRAMQREATGAELASVVQCFADAARRVQDAGLDGVEIHAGHGYLISTFLSPVYNRRQDGYGGSEENRARLLVEVVGAIRRACGDSFAILVRLDGQEYDSPDGHGVGIDPALAARYAARAERAGADAIHVSASSMNSMSAAFTDGPLPWMPGQYLGLARTVKSLVSIPVIAVGRISPDLAERTLARGDTCDFVSMGRQLLADPEIPKRLVEGRPDLIRTCINCFVCVAQNFWDGIPVCAVNTRLGHYAAKATGPRSHCARRVVVVGGGPAGMEAARVAAQRGHRVVLMEKRRLGGTAWLSALTTPANAELIRFLHASLVELGVEIRLGTEAGLECVVSERPDAVVVATGARRNRPPVPGGDLPHVLSGDDLRELLSPGPGARRGAGRGARWLLGAGHRLGALDTPDRIRRLSRFWMPLGRRVVIVGGGLVGLELAEFLAERGRRVILLEESPYLGTEMALPRRMRAVYHLERAGVRAVRSAQLLHIDEQAVIYRREAEMVRADADHVLFASGVEPDTSLADELTAAGLVVHPAGDCVEVAYIQGAIRSGAAAADLI